MTDNSTFTFFSSLSLMLSTVCIYLIALSSSFEWFRVSRRRRLLLSIERKANKQQDWIPITVGETFYYPCLSCRLIFLIIATRHLLRFLIQYISRKSSSIFVFLITIDSDRMYVSEVTLFFLFRLAYCVRKLAQV